jgi:hypothetical protein
MNYVTVSSPPNNNQHIQSDDIITTPPNIIINNTNNNLVAQVAPAPTTTTIITTLTKLTPSPIYNPIAHRQQFEDFLLKNYSGKSRCKVVYNELGHKIMRAIKTNFAAPFTPQFKFQVLKKRQFSIEKNADGFEYLECNVSLNRGIIRRPVCYVEDFFNIISQNHVTAKGHLGLVQTRQQICLRFSCLPKPVITFFVRNCTACQSGLSDKVKVPLKANDLRFKNGGPPAMITADSSSKQTVTAAPVMVNGKPQPALVSQSSPPTRNLVVNKTFKTIRLVITDKSKETLLQDELKNGVTRDLSSFSEELLKPDNYGLITVYWFNEETRKYDGDSKASIRFAKSFKHRIELNPLTNCLNIGTEDE